MKRTPAAQPARKIYGRPTWEGPTGFLRPGHSKVLSSTRGVVDEAAPDVFQVRRKRGRPSYAPWFKQRAEERLRLRQMPRRPTLSCFAKELLQEYVETHPNEPRPRNVRSVENMVSKVYAEMH
jgi:hypothetical protein